jgi:hypothetical protein
MEIDVKKPGLDDIRDLLSGRLDDPVSQKRVWEALQQARQDAEFAGPRDAVKSPMARETGLVQDLLRGKRLQIVVGTAAAILLVTLGTIVEADRRSDRARFAKMEVELRSARAEVAKVAVELRSARAEVARPSRPDGKSELALALSELESDLRVRHVAQIVELTRAAAPGQQPNLDGSLTQNAHYTDRIRFLKGLAHRMGEGQTHDVLGYDDARLWLAARLYARRRADSQNSARPILVLNGVPESQIDSYAYAEGVIDFVEPLARPRRQGILDKATRQALLEWVNSQPDQPWPEALPAKLAEAVGAERVPPIVIVVNIHLDSPDRSRGTLRALEFDPQKQDRHPAVETEKFVQSHPPIALFQVFHSPIEVSEGAKLQGGRDRLTLIFTESRAPWSRVTLSADPPGLSVRDRFPGGAEVVFDAKATFDGQGRPPPVSFGTGGDGEMTLSLTPPLDLGPEWKKRITIPVDLAGVKHWKTGLTVAAQSVSAGARLTITIQNAFIRPLGDGWRSPQSQ